MRKDATNVGARLCAPTDTDTSNLPELPRAWVWTTVGDIYDIVGGGTPSTEVAEYWGGDIPWITSADIYGLKDIKPRKRINQKAIKNSATNLVPKGSLIVVTRVGLGKVALTQEPICFSQDSQALVGNETLIYSDYSLYYLAQAVQIFKYRHRGTTIAGVTKKQLSDLAFALPPLAEQSRIVAKTEELFTELDAGVEALQKVKAQLKRYRQAVLKHAFAGKLTAEWRATHWGELEPASMLLERIRSERAKTVTVGAHSRAPRARAPRLYTMDTSSLPQLPCGWVWTGLREICKEVEKTYPQANPDDEFVYIDIASIDNEQQRIVQPKRYLGRDAPSRARQLVCSGDILFSTVRTYLKNIAMVNEEYDGQIASTGFCVIRPSYGVNNRFIFSLTQTEGFLNPLTQLQRGTSYPAVRDSDVFAQFVPLPPLVEQHKIVEEIERRFSIADEVEKVVEQSLKQAERLRQSILKRAFEGKLVPQDPNDEPADKLLERIVGAHSRAPKTARMKR